MNAAGDVAVVIPAKNEAQRIDATVQSARALLGVGMVVVVDDGSTDDTRLRALRAGAHVISHRRNRGKAAAMETGAAAVRVHDGPKPRHLLFSMRI